MAVLNKAEARKYRASKHASRSQTCYCGREVFGNGGWASHAKRCPTYRAERGVFVPDWQMETLFREGYHVAEINRMALDAAAQGQDRL